MFYEIGTQNVNPISTDFKTKCTLKQAKFQILLHHHLFSELKIIKCGVNQTQ